MAVLVGEAHAFVFDARAIARADAFDLTRVHRALVQVLLNQLVRLGAGPGLPARQQSVPRVCRVVDEAERPGVGLAGQLRRLAKVDSAQADPRGGSGLESSDV